MLFAVVAIDRPGRLPVRKKTRPEHLAYLTRNIASVVVAGPFLAEDGTPVGSMLVIEAKTLAAAVAFMAKDPYAKAKLFESVTVRPWSPTLGSGVKAKKLPKAKAAPKAKRAAKPKK